MNIADIKNKKARFSIEVVKLLTKFEKETGTSVTKILVNRAYDFNKTGQVTSRSSRFKDIEISVEI